MADVTVTTHNIFGAAIVDMVVTATPNSTPFASGQNLIVSGAKSDKTDSNGQVLFSGMEAGVYTFTFEGRPDSIQKVVPDSASAFDFVDLDDYTGTNTSLSLPSATYVQRDGTNGFGIGSDAEGDMYYRNSSGNLVRLAVGTDDQVIKASGGVPVYANATGGGDVNGPASSTNGNLPSFNGTGGKTLQDSGIAAADVVTGSSTDTFTNKAFDANGTGNSLSNVETADLASGSKTGADSKLVTGTAGTNGDLAQWNGDGDLVDGPTPPSGSIVGTTDAQALTNKTVDDHLTVKEIAAPSTPSTGYGALYAKTDGKLYWKDDGGTESDLTASGGSSLPVDDTTAVVRDPVDNTKLARIDAEAISTGTTRVITMGDRDVDLASGGTFAEASHNHAASDINSGTLAHERGGLEADVSAYAGLVKISGGATSAVTAPSGTIVGTTDTQTLSGKSFSDHITVDEISAPGTPSTGKVAIYAKTDGKLYIKDDGGTETDLTSGGSGGGKIVQAVHAEDGTYASDSTAIPLDDTLPQNTEGYEVETVTITPTSATNYLYINAQTFMTSSSTTSRLVAALFKDSGADAIAVSSTYNANSANSSMQEISISCRILAGSTSAQTFKLRAGANTGTIYFHGDNSARLYGGKLLSFIRIFEVDES